MTAETTAAKLNSIMEKVRNLLELANHPSTPAAEAESARTKAEAMMLKYRIEESSLSFEERAISGIKPVKRSWTLCRSSSEFTNEMYNLALWAIDHVGGKCAYRIESTPEGRMLVLDVYGFESDVRYAEAIFTASQVTFSARLEPKIDRNDSDQINAYKLRASGVERNRVAYLLWGTTDHSANARVQKLYKAECDARGEVAAMGGRGNTTKTYRRSYSRAFVDEVSDRLWQLRLRRGIDSDGALVLRSREEEVNELFYSDHPYMRPETPEQKAEREARMASQPKPKERKLRARKYKPAPVNDRAAMMGRDAAKRVDLTGGNVPTERTVSREDKTQIGA